MFGWFKKREPQEPAAISEPRDWVNIKAEMSGRPVFIRLRASLRDPAVQRAYGHEICTRITFHQLQDNGLPSSDEELTAVDELEDWLKDRLEASSRTLLALVVTGYGVRDCFFYSSDPQSDIRVWEQELQPSIHSHQVTFNIRPDPQWQMYKRFLG